MLNAEEQPHKPETFGDEDGFGPGTIIQVGVDETVEHLLIALIRTYFIITGKTIHTEDFIALLPPNGAADIAEAAAQFPDLFENADALTEFGDWIFRSLDVAVKYFSDNAQSRLQDVMKLTFNESIIFATSAIAKERGIRAAQSPAELIKRIEAQESQKLRQRLRFGPGGDRRKPAHEWDDDECKRFALKVRELHPLWKFIASFFKGADYDVGCPHAVKELSEFKQLSASCKSVPDNLLIRVFQREKHKGTAYSPLALALEHARRECDIEYKYRYDALNKFYGRGLRLLNLKKA